jgi:uroporphyrinogen-III synthase
MSHKPLAGRSVAIPETRELDLLAQMLEDKGARTVRCPMVTIQDAPDAAPIEAWLEELAGGRFSDLILLTGEGLRRLLGFAQRAGNRDRVVAALRGVRKITRGPKPARALREIGLTPDLAAELPTTDGVIAGLSKEPMTGRVVGVQLYGQDPNQKLVAFLEQNGATVRTVAPYVYAPASDEQRVLDLIVQLERGEVDLIAFTSAPQVERLWDVAGKYGVLASLTTGMAHTHVAAVGPVVSAKLREHGVAVQIAPDSSFFMRPMVNEIIKHLPARAHQEPLETLLQPPDTSR